MLIILACLYNNFFFIHSLEAAACSGRLSVFKSIQSTDVEILPRTN